MTPTDKTALAARLRGYAKEYSKLIARGTGPLVNDLNAAADELDQPAFVATEEVAQAFVAAPVASTQVGQIQFPKEIAQQANPVANQGGSVVLPKEKS